MVSLQQNVFTDAEPPTGSTTEYVEHVTVGDADLDAELRLQGTARADYLGTRGHEIA